MSVRVSRLNNGIRVATDSMPHLETASIGAWFDVGARYEDEAENGISHLLEHMAFKGTESRTARQLAEEIEAVGGHLNAYTSRDHTTYYARVMKNDVPLAVDILSDILQRMSLDETELAREKHVIIQEIGQSHDSPDDLVFDLLQEKAYPDQPIGRSILGTIGRVGAFTAADIRSYMTTHYSADRMVFVGAGNISHDDLVAQVSEGFAGMQTAEHAAAEPARYVGGRTAVERPLEQLHLTIGLPGVSYTDPAFFAMQVFNAIIGGGMSSRLFQEIREERGLAYSVYSFSTSQADGGMFGIYAGTGPENIEELMQVIGDQLQGMTGDIADEEIDRAKAQLKAGLLMSLESTSSRIEQLGRQMLIFDRPLSTEELVGKVDAITRESLTEVAEQVLAGPPTMATVGPLTSLNEMEFLGQ